MTRILKNGVEYGLGGKDLIDKIYPVGSIYISTSSTFNPQTAWGGTWRKTADGRCLIGANSTYPLGTTGGSATHMHTTQAHAITQNEMNSHAHNLKLFIFNGVKNYGTKFGLAANVGDGRPGGNGLGDWWNSTAGQDSATRGNGIGNVGGNVAHSHGDTGSASNMQPYLAVYIWERTA